MKLTKLFKSLAMTAVIVATSYTSVSADSLDSYRQLLASNNFTLKYENISPAARNKNGDAVYMTNRSSMDVTDIDYMTNKATKCIVVASGDKRYEEVAINEAAACRLRDADEMFVFSRVAKNGQNTYVGKKKGEVTAIAVDHMSIAANGESFGGDDATILLNAMMPNNSRPAGGISYSKIGEGNLQNGLSYIDYKAHYAGRLELIRYYFKGNEMVKIAAGFYTTNSSGDITNGRHCILNIEQFNSEVDRNYLRLPAELKDKTDRKNKSNS